MAITLFNLALNRKNRTLSCPLIWFMATKADVLRSIFDAKNLSSFRISARNELLIDFS